MDDIQLLFIETSDFSAGAPSGWAHLPGSPRPQGSNVVSVNVMWKRATSNTSDNQRIFDPGNHQVGFMVLVRGCRTVGDPWTFTAGSGAAASSTSFTAQSGTTTEDQSLVIAATATNLDSSTNPVQSMTATGLENFMQVAQAATDLGNGGGIAVWAGVKTSAGLVPSIAGALSSPAATSNLVFALSPA